MRTMNHRLLETIANDPAVRPFMASNEEEVKLEQVITRPGNYTFTNDEGGFIYLRQDEDLYEAHTIFKPGCNVREVVKLMNESLEFMFIETPCLEMRTKVPTINRPARHLALTAHFNIGFERKDAWAPGVDITYMNLPLDRWADVCSTRLRGMGAAFRAQIEEAKQAADVEVPLHSEDSTRDLYVGLAAMMLRAGNTEKAVTVFNRVAVFAGYPLWQIVSEHPVVVHVGDAVLQIRNGETEVLLCR